MTHEELHEIVSGGESATVEFKRSTGQRSDGAKAVCAMLNGRGGFVIFGVTDRGEITGQDVSAHTIESVVTELRRIDPRALLEPEPIDLGDGKQAVVIRVPSGRSDGPYTYDGRPYIREGPTTVLMPRERYHHLLLERTHPTQRWEIQPAYRLGIEDLDHTEITRTIDEAIRRGRMEEPGTRDIGALLHGLGVVRAGELLNAAVVLFARPTA